MIMSKLEYEDQLLLEQSCVDAWQQHCAVKSQ